jgi:hypothetical protein
MDAGRSVPTEGGHGRQALGDPVYRGLTLKERPVPPMVNGQNGLGWRHVIRSAAREAGGELCPYRKSRLRAKRDAAEDVAIMDLRTTLDVSAVPYVIPGSRWVPAEHLDERLLDIPRNREWVLYCS